MYCVFNMSTGKYKGPPRSKGWVKSIKKAKKYKSLAAAQKDIISSTCWANGNAVFVVEYGFVTCFKKVHEVKG